MLLLYDNLLNVKKKNAEISYCEEVLSFPVKNRKQRVGVKSNNLILQYVAQQLWHLTYKAQISVGGYRSPANCFRL